MADSELADEEYDEPNQREGEAWRAFKAAVIGVLFVPLQLYAIWLVLTVLFDEAPLRSRYRWYAIAAGCLSVPYLMLATLMFHWIFKSP